MTATIKYNVAETRLHPSDTSIVLSVTLEMIAEENGKEPFRQFISTSLPEITKDDAKFTDISSLSGEELNTKLLNFAKNNWGYPENAVPSLSAMETYAKNEVARIAKLEG